MRNFPQFDETVVRPVYFIEITFDSGPFLANTSDRNITVGGKLYYGVGTLGRIGDYTTTNGVTATALKLTLTNIPSTMTGDVVNENTRNKPVKVSIALVDKNNQLVTGLIVWFNGTIDSLTVDLGQVVSVAASASSRLINWARSINSRYTNEDQQAKYPNDKGFKFIASMPTLKVRWGS